MGLDCAKQLRPILPGGVAVVILPASEVAVVVASSSGTRVRSREVRGGDRPGGEDCTIAGTRRSAHVRPEGLRVSFGILTALIAVPVPTPIPT